MSDATFNFLTVLISCISSVILAVLSFYIKRFDNNIKKYNNTNEKNILLIRRISTDDIPKLIREFKTDIKDIHEELREQRSIILSNSKSPSDIIHVSNRTSDNISETNRASDIIDFEKTSS